MDKDNFKIKNKATLQILSWFAPIFFIVSLIFDIVLDWNSLPRSGSLFVLSAVIIQFSIMKEEYKLLNDSFESIGGLIAGYSKNEKISSSNIPSQFNQDLPKVKNHINRPERENHITHYNRLTTFYAVIGTVFWAYGELIPVSRIFKQLAFL